jgi:hypothetical protein
MSKCTEIRKICAVYFFDVEYSDNEFTMFFNSRRNAETVKRCIEVDDSVPNAATAVDFVEVVRCRDCKYYKVYEPPIEDFDGFCTANENEYDKEFYCQYGERKEG